TLDFRRRCLEKLESSGDLAVSNERHGAVSHYPTSLVLKPATVQNLLIKRSKAYMAKGLTVEALNDANKVIELDPLSPWGYERKHAALHKAGCHQDAINAFDAMLSRMSQSSDPEIRALHCQYIDPKDTRETIRRAVQGAVCDSPRVLINTLSGRLCDKSQQAASFESHAAFDELVSSMTTCIDDVRIKDEVTKYYRYGMFSHEWEDNEPLFERVVCMVVYELEQSPTHDTLKMFCKIVQDAGLQWAWSDMCCINKADHFVPEESLVAMFKWYQGSDLTIVFLFDVLSPSRRGDLMRSISNSRAWTFQASLASKVVRFYTKDWKLYMDLDIPNHKESSEIISEMEEATGVSAQALMALRPGLDKIREKLCLASTRRTTLVEDAAYSLFGIPPMSLPVVYGEGDHALGRLLAQLLTSSGDTSILAWTGKSGSFNSCFPTNIIVFKQLPPSHIPPTIATTEMEELTTTLRVSLLSSASVMELYDQLHDLPLPLFVGQRLKLPCLRFTLGAVRSARNAGGHVFRAQTNMLGIVEVRTEEDLSRFSPLYLVHPWIDFLLDRQPVGSIIETISEENTEDRSFSIGELPRSSLSAREEKLIGAFQMIARLKQPFGVLLLAVNPGKVASYRRVAPETFITAELKEITPTVLKKLISSVSVLDVL
ncbi:hypothetical protein V8E55_001217, partial [Tylopilus felleus]